MKKAILETAKELLRLSVVAVIAVISEYVSSKFGASGGEVQILVVAGVLRLLDKAKFYFDKEAGAEPKGLLRF